MSSCIAKRITKGHQKSVVKEGEFEDSARGALVRQRQSFRKHFGRDPRPEDPVFFDPFADEPRFLDEEGEERLIRMSEMAMRRAGIDLAKIYAWRKTGLFVSDENEHLLSADDFQDWLDAFFEYNGEAICLHLHEAHGRDPEAAAREAGRIFADTGERVCPHCGQELEYSESAWGR